MRVIICGDYCPRYKVADTIEEGGFSSILGDIETEISSADYSIVNMECPVIENNLKPIIKNGPNLGCSSKGIECLKWAGFNCVTLANNHFLDYGEEGVKTTIDTIRRYELDYVGGGMNSKDASAILYKRIGETTLSLINCCEHEFSIATEKTAGANPINPISQYYKIKEAQKKSDFCLVIVHGGIEHYNLPTPRLQEYCRFLIDAGANAVICHHQHCYSGFEDYHNGTIFYGLGNFCFDGNRASGKESWYQGYMVDLTIEKEFFKYTLIPYVQCEKTTNVVLAKESDKERFLQNVQMLNEKISSSSTIKAEYEKLVSKNRPLYEDAIAPYSNRYLRALRRRGLIPSFFSIKRIAKIKNYVECESHRDQLISVLNNLCQK